MMFDQEKFSPLDLTKKKILITGASSGIGRGTALYLSKLGAKLVLLGRSESRLQETLKQLVSNAHEVIPADLTDLEDMTPLFEEAVSDGIKLSGLIHCAGIAQVIPLNSLTRNKVVSEMNINYFSFIELVRQYAKKKFSDGGSIVAISSVAAERPDKCQTNYAATKAALDIASQALSIELAVKNIRINTILPGAIMTEKVRRSQDNGIDLEQIKRRQLLGMGQPEDVAAMCAFLMSDMSRFITGRRLFVDGGRFL